VYIGKLYIIMYTYCCTGVLVNYIVIRVFVIPLAALDAVALTLTLARGLPFFFRGIGFFGFLGYVAYQESVQR